jgi:hypothetical protein
MRKAWCISILKLAKVNAREDGASLSLSYHEN